jgi:hypothetical protein
MSIIVEDGSGKSNSETLISVADSDAYFISRGNTVWAGIATDAEKEQLLRKASDYIIGTYGSRWSGARVFSTQALDWPRVGVVTNHWLVESDIVPIIVANASAELALQAHIGELLPNTEQSIKREKIGPIETEFNDFATSETKYTQVDRLLSAFFSSSGSTVNLIRS